MRDLFFEYLAGNPDALPMAKYRCLFCDTVFWTDPTIEENLELIDNELKICCPNCGIIES
jgi:DNA-directed RNA polymerase subunit RPC12/RpoP